MDRVIAAQVYMRICELGSLSAAARALGMSRPMVSRYLEQMEHWAGTRLIHRSTRKLTLTSAGEKVLQKTRSLTQLADEIAGQTERAVPSGTLRVACAHFTAMQLLSPLLPEFLARYPQLRLELDINNHPVSLIGERIDVAIRITDNPEPGAIARRLGICRSVLCASPRWLQQHGQINSPEELSQHNCLHYSHFATPTWQFTDPQGEPVSVAVSGNLSAGISSLLMEAAVAGCGIAMLPELEARRAAAVSGGHSATVVPGQLELSILTPLTSKRSETMAIHKKGQAHWEGDLKSGKGTVSTESGALNQQPYGFNTRFEGVKGTNPEELIGAAHAACFSMALSLMLSEEGYTATSIDTVAVVTLDKSGGGFAITKIALQSNIVLPGIDKAAFDPIIQKAKAGCPVSQVLKADISLDYQLNA